MPTTTPTTPLRILHLEDNPDDVVLTQRTLASDGVDARFEVAETAAGFQAALDRGALDLILSDFALPGFDGLWALDRARESVPDVPFILVSGTIGEEVAVECVRRGATDYVLKQRISRLTVAVRRALLEIEERRLRREAEEGLQQEQRFLAAVVNSVDAGIIACNARGELRLFNRAAGLLDEISQIPAPPERWAEVYGLFHPDGRTRMKMEEIPLYRALQGERVKDVEMVVTSPDGAMRTMLASGQPILDAHDRKIGAVVALHDITERKALEDQFRQAQKMEAIGRLAGGVAHDFNNLLSVILGYGDMLLSERPADPAVRSKLEQIQRAGERATTLTRQLLAFSRKQAVEPKVIDLNALLGDMEKMLRRLLTGNIEVVTLMSPTLSRIKVDPGQLEQVIMNLAVNARDAMPQGGRLTIETANVHVAEGAASQDPGTLPGPHVMIRVGDTGTGMPPDVLGKIFEPFFTTKRRDEGTGLGLSTVYGIVKQAGGKIEVESTPGTGSSFRILFPAVNEPVESARGTSVGASPRGSETILVVEDDPAVRSLASEILRSFGYTVLVAASADEGCSASRSHAGQLHLLLTDVVLPGANGREMATEILRERPGLMILYMSGYPDESIRKIIGTEGSVQFLQKPFTPLVLATRVRSVLNLALAASR